VRLPHQRDPGHIGPPLPHTKIEARRPDGAACAVGETGVLWIRGPQVMRGYYENPTRTAEVLTTDGWFNSGDLGHVDVRGNVWITGRAKDTIVLSGGENVEPEPVEAIVKTSRFVEQVVLVGQDQKNLGALLVPQLEVLAHEVPREQWEPRDGVLHGRAVHALLRRELDRLLVFRVLADPLTPENGLLTQTMKVRRHVVAQRFAPLLAEMFGGS
jgi:long-chain acyl-CoA synthetase